MEETYAQRGHTYRGDTHVEGTYSTREGDVQTEGPYTRRGHTPGGGIHTRGNTYARGIPYTGGGMRTEGGGRSGHTLRGHTYEAKIIWNDTHKWDIQRGCGGRTVDVSGDAC